MSQRSRFTKAKVLLLGAPGVGKTAFTVRYLTRRFIGEYDPNKEMLYTHKLTLDRDEVLLEILDTAYECEEGLLESHMRWADGYILMYAVTDKNSYKEAERLFHLLHTVNKTDENTPLVLVANKTDLTFARKVSETEGADLSRSLACPMYEISIADSPDGVMETMDEVLRQIKREFVKAASAGLEKKSTFTNVKRVLKKKIYRSRSDTM